MEPQDITAEAETKEKEFPDPPDIQDLGFSFSKDVGKLAEALAKAQGEIQAAVRDAKNPFHRSTYADLCSVWEACRDPLSKNGLAILQPTAGNGNGTVELITMLIHSSGQWIKGTLKVTPGKIIKEGQNRGSFQPSQDPQSLGSALTYARRYGLAAMVGVAPEGEDDDGERAMGRDSGNGHRTRSSGNNKPKLTTDQEKKKKRLVSWLFAEANNDAKSVGATVKSLTNNIYSNVNDMTPDHFDRFWEKCEKDVREFENATKELTTEA